MLLASEEGCWSHLLPMQEGHMAQSFQKWMSLGAPIDRYCGLMILSVICKGHLESIHGELVMKKIFVRGLLKSYVSFAFF